MKNIFFSLLLILISCSVYAQTNLIKADSAYSKGDYKQAVQLYEEVLKNEGESSDLYYNLGNAYFKDKQIAQSILNYERALLLDPGNNDAAFNLKIAQTRIVDRIEPIGTFFFVQWIGDIKYLMSSNQWAVYSIGFFIILIVGLSLYFFGKKIIYKKIGFFAALLFGVLCICSNIFAFQLKQQYVNRNSAIIFASTVSIKGSPAESGTDLFVLHEGTKVAIRQWVGKWAEIELSDGNIGWIDSKDFKKI